MLLDSRLRRMHRRERRHGDLQVQKQRKRRQKVRML
jgi:hypothetical protein